MPSTKCPPEVWLLKRLILRVFSIVIGPEEGRPEDTSIDAGLVSNDAIFLIVPCVASNRYNCVAPSWQFLEMEQVHRLCADQGLLRVVKNMSQRVHSHEVVAGVNSHGLLAHCALICVSGRL